MRVIKEFTLSQSIKCTVFSWNGKYIIKLEMGNLEQTYKVSEMDVTGLADVDSLISSPEFCKKAEQIFQTMEQNLDPIF
jgi:hypothetical protein